MKAQSRNRRNTCYMTYKGERKPVSEVADILGMNYQTLYDRLERGLTDEEAVDEDFVYSRRIGHQRQKRVTITNKISGEKIEFESCTKASKFFGYNSGYLYNKSKKKGTDKFDVKGYYVELGDYNKPFKHK